MLIAGQPGGNHPDVSAGGGGRTRADLWAADGHAKRAIRGKPLSAVTLAVCSEAQPPNTMVPGLKSATRRRRSAPWLRQELDEAHASRRMAAKEDAVRIRWIDLDTADVEFRVGPRGLQPRLGAWIEARDHVDLVLARPDIVVPLVGGHRIVPGGLRRRRVERHGAGLVVDLHELAGQPVGDPDVAIDVVVHAPGI